jgi:sporulation protein YlmC with PRC-barrel domain
VVLNIKAAAYFIYMEVLYNKLKKKDVVSLSDGKNLGRVCDMEFFYPQNNLKGYYVTGCRGFKFNKQQLFIPVGNIVKIGEDVILTNFNCKPPQPKPPKGERGNNCPPQNCQPQNNCPPPYGGNQQNNCSPESFPKFPPDDE